MSSFFRRFLGKFLIGLGAYIFIILTIVYSVGIFMGEGLLSHLDALTWCLINVVMIILGKLIHPKAEPSHKYTDVEQNPKSIFDIDVLKLTVTGWLFLYSCVAFQALMLTLVVATLPESIQGNTKLIGTLILGLVFAYAYFIKKYFVKKGIKFLSD